MPPPRDHEAIPQLRIDRIFTRRALGGPGPLRQRLNGCPWLKDYLVWERPAGGYVSYERWTSRQRERLDEIFDLLVNDRADLGLNLPGAESSRALANRPLVGGRALLLTAAQAFDVYAAHVAHALMIEAKGLVPWSIADMSDLELTELLASHRYHSRILVRSGYQDYYPPQIRAERDYQQPEWTANAGALLGDPRAGFRFMQGETSSRRTNLIGTTTLETLVNLTRWCAENVRHSGPAQETQEWRASHAFLEDRLRAIVPEFEPDNPPRERPGPGRKPRIIATFGCHGAMNLLRDLARSVNLPLLQLNCFDSPGNRPTLMHNGLLFVEPGSWGTAPRLRMLWHADEIYADGMPPVFPLTQSGQAMDAAAMWRAFFDAHWLAPSIWAAWGFVPPAEFEAGVRNHPDDDRPTLGIDGGSWRDIAHRDAFQFERAMKLGSWRRFLVKRCDNPFNENTDLDREWENLHGDRSSPLEVYRSMAEMCVRQYGGCATFRRAFDNWRNLPGNYFRG